MRSIWTGAISFGLVNIPINLYSATRSQRPSFKMLHKTDLSPIEYLRICKKTKEEVPFTDIVKGYEFQEGFYVVLDEADFKRADPEKSRLIKISKFLDEREINSALYEKPYYLEPIDNSGKAFALFRQALSESKKVAFGQFVLRNKEYLVVIKPQDNVLVLNEIRFADELLDSSNLNFQEKAEYSADELKIAKDLINQMSGDFDIKKYEDTYSKKLENIIKEKAEGKIPAEEIEEQPMPETFDLMEKLKESLQKAKAESKK